MIEYNDFVPVATKMLQATAHVEDKGCPGVDAVYISVTCGLRVN